ncbi:MAG: aminopeptidase P family protein [Chloroflexi bacterium]|nr:aminopeptidase P family protein [Chloroflexota bacterium]
MHQFQRDQTRQLLRERGVDAALFADPHSVTWLTGFVASIELGPNLFAGALPLVWYADGRFTLVVVDALAEAASPFGREPDGAVASYLGYTIEQPIEGLRGLLDVLSGLWGNASRNVAVEIMAVTAAVLDVLRVGPPVRAPIDATDWLKPLRCIKTAEEIAKLRENFRLTDIGHRAAAEATRAGAREIDVWAAIHAAIDSATGCRVPLGNDCVVGYRQANIGGWPLDYVIRPGDSLIVDLSTIRHGYWSDSCNTYYPAHPTARQSELRAIAAAALAYGATLLKPGAVARDIDRELRAFMVRAGQPVYPHHTGHGVGVSGHESPRIVPYCEETLAAGMVIMLEPGAYYPGETGVRLEDAFLITPDGAERLTTHLL